MTRAGTLPAATCTGTGIWLHTRESTGCYGRSPGRFDKLPAPVREFYLLRLADELREKVTR